MYLGVQSVTGKKVARAHALVPKSPCVVVLWEGGRAIALTPRSGTLTIGRGPSCDLVVDHRSVSRLHAKLHVDDDGFSIEDLGSSNGTRVQGEQVASGGRVVIMFGDVVEIGETLLTLQEAEGSGETPAAVIE